jgi:hypothetical protein
MAQNGNFATILVKNIPIFVEKPDFIAVNKELPKLHFLT